MTATCALWGQQIWSARAANGQNISSRRVIKNALIVHPNRVLLAHDKAPGTVGGAYNTLHTLLEKPT